MIQTDVCIIGAGPGGAATALRLSHLGFPSLLVDKAVFPRDKVCGDGLTGKVVAILNRIDAGILERFGATPQQIDSWGAMFAMIGGIETLVPYRKIYNRATDPIPSYVTKRIDFDHFLVEECKKRDNIEVIEGVNIEVHERTPDGWLLSDKKGTTQIQCRMVVVANGANSLFTRHVANIQMEPKLHAGAVRAYYKNVQRMHPENFIELHFLKNYLPGYFWIFPLPDGEANVGFGMLTETISQKKINLKKTLLEIVSEVPEVAARFKEAELIGDIVGYGLPLGSKRRVLSGDNYVLVGDAAHLIDPLTGEGIGNAVYSGYIIADLIPKCLEQNDFSAKFLQAYDERVYRVMGMELKVSHQMQKLLKHPMIFNFILKLAAKNVQFSDLIYAMFKDIDVRKRLMNPAFWWKLALNKA